MKKLLSSDWLRAVQFHYNTRQITNIKKVLKTKIKSLKNLIETFF